MLRKTKIPKKYKNYKFNTEGYLINENGNRIVANAKSAGTPKYQAINNQFIYAGNYSVRMNIVNGLKKFLLPYVQQVPIITTLPIIIECEIYQVPGRNNWDIENFGVIYSKVFNDLLVSEGKIPDDSIRYITKPGSGPLYTPIENIEDRKMVFYFIHDNREVIQQYKLWEL